MSLPSKVLKIFSLSTEEDFGSEKTGHRTGGTMATLGNLLPLILLVIFIGVVAVIGYQVSHLLWLLLLPALPFVVSDYILGNCYDTSKLDFVTPKRALSCWTDESSLMNW